MTHLKFKPAGFHNLNTIRRDLSKEKGAPKFVTVTLVVVTLVFMDGGKFPLDAKLLSKAEQ